MDYAPSIFIAELHSFLFPSPCVGSLSLYFSSVAFDKKKAEFDTWISETLLCLQNLSACVCSSLHTQANVAFDIKKCYFTRKQFLKNDQETKSLLITYVNLINSFVAWCGNNPFIIILCHDLHFFCVYSWVIGWNCYLFCLYLTGLDLPFSS